MLLGFTLEGLLADEKKLGLGIPLWLALKLLALEPAGLQRFRSIGSVSLAARVVTGVIISYICRGL